MCWVSNNCPCVQIAEKDIPVFKILHKNLTSAYFNFPYNVGEIYKIEEIDVGCNYGKYYINTGFHSYDSSLVSVICRGFLIEVVSGFDRLDHFSATLYRIVDCIIPEGSRYYKNKKGEIVSDCIKICKVRE